MKAKGLYNKKLVERWNLLPKANRPSQEDLSKILNVTQSALSRYLSGEKPIDFYKTLLISQELDIRVDGLWDGDSLEGMKTLTINQIEGFLSDLAPEDLENLEARLEALLHGPN